jgi:hypothetical protein
MGVNRARSACSIHPASLPFGRRGRADMRISSTSFLRMTFCHPKSLMSLSFCRPARAQRRSRSSRSSPSDPELFRDWSGPSALRTRLQFVEQKGLHRRDLSDRIGDPLQISELGEAPELCARDGQHSAVLAALAPRARDFRVTPLPRELGLRACLLPRCVTRLAVGVASGVVVMVWRLILSLCSRIIWPRPK